MDSARVKCQHQSNLRRFWPQWKLLGKATRNGRFLYPSVTVSQAKLLMVVCSTSKRPMKPQLYHLTRVRSCQISTPARVLCWLMPLSCHPAGVRPLVPKTWKSIQKPRKSSSRTLMVRREVMDIPILELWFPGSAVNAGQPSGNSSKLSKTAPMARVRPSAGSDLLKVEKREQNLRWLCKCR